MLETMKYVRKPFYIDAVRVTAENITDVANWAGGDVRTDSDGRYIKVRVPRALTERQTKAYVGDWVLYAGKGYKVYTPKAFDDSFEQASVETTMHPTKPEAAVEAEVEVTKTRVRKPAKVVETVDEVAGDVVVSTT